MTSLNKKVAYISPFCGVRTAKSCKKSETLRSFLSSFFALCAQLLRIFLSVWPLSKDWRLSNFITSSATNSNRPVSIEGLKETITNHCTRIAIRTPRSPD